MSVLFNFNERKYNVLNVSYKKVKINNFFLNNKFIIFLSISFLNIFKNKILNNGLSSIHLKEKYIKFLFKK